MKSKKSLLFNITTIAVCFFVSFLGSCLLIAVLYKEGVIMPQKYNTFTNQASGNLTWPVTTEISSNNQQTSADFKTAEFPLKKFIADNGKAVTDFLAKNKISGNYGVYFADVSNPENVFTHNPNMDFAPASMYKVPLTIVVLHLIEKGEFKLTDVISVQKTGTSEYKNMSVGDTISIMIRESNNEAMTALEHKAGGYERVQNFYTQLGFKIIRRGQHVTVMDFAKAFGILVDKNNNFINQASKDYLLDHMFNVVSNQRDRIPTGVTEYFSEQDNQAGLSKIKVANKIGNLDGVYQDGAIIFGQNRTYILIILDKNQITNTARENIHSITKLLLNNLE